MVLVDGDIIYIDETPVECLHCFWTGCGMDLNVMDEDIDDNSMYLACPVCGSKKVKILIRSIL